VVAKVKERLTVSKQRLHRLLMERFNLKKLNKAKDKEQCEVEIFLNKLHVSAQLATFRCTKL
jgi:hypothetical protein